MENKRPQIVTIRKRSDFILASRELKEYSTGLNIQARKREYVTDSSRCFIRIGITCSKKVGNAVLRNKAKRRLRALSRLVLPSYGRKGWDYILIGKPTETCGRPFKLLVQDLQTAISNLHKKAE